MTGPQQDAALEPPLRPSTPARRVVAEALGTALLVAIVVGSGIMGERLAGGNAAIALLGNTAATGAGLVVLIMVFGPISGAHFNPVVSLIFALRREIGWRLAGVYALAQVGGGAVGAVVANLMFGLPAVTLATKARSGLPLAFAEAVATFGLVATILGTLRLRPSATPAAVGLYIVAGYWFTASTSFANPAVTLARTLSDSFAGIAPASAPGFILGQLAGALAGLGVFTWLLREEPARA